MKKNIPSFINLLFPVLIALIYISCVDPCSEIDGSYQILVDFSPFTSVEEANRSHVNIDWSEKVLSKMNACSESFAATELRTYLLKLKPDSIKNKDVFTVHSLQTPIASKSIVLANLSNPHIKNIAEKEKLFEKLKKEESFAIVPQGHTIYIIGADRIGTLYGVYHFLELLGIRWYAPGEMSSVVPVLNSIKIPTETIIEEPKFITRGFWAWEDRGNEEFYLWMARNRLNFWTIAEPNHGFLKKIGIQLTAGGHLHFDRFLNPNDEYPYNYALYQGDEDKPEDPYKVSSPEYRRKKTKNKKLTYFEAHPEWYGLVKGERRSFEGDFGTNICTSNNDAIIELCRKLIDDLAVGEWCNINTLNFWPLDVGKWCECEKCKALGTPTDRLLILIHQVRSAIVTAMLNGQINRNVKVIFPIYTETLSPPTKALPEGFDYDNCIGTFFPIRRCYVHFLNDTSCTEYNTEIWNEFLGWIEEEPRYYRGQFFIGEYYNVSSIRSLPVLYPRIMEHDIPLYYKNGVRHAHYMHVNTRSWGPKRINNYLFAKLLWNHELKVDQVLDEYFQQFYSGASKQMQILYQQLEYAMSSVKQWKHTKPLTTRINNNASPLFDLQHLQLKESHPPINDGVDLEESVIALKKCRDIINNLLTQEWPEQVKQRIIEDDTHLKYAENTVNLYYYIAQTIIARNNKDLDESLKMYKLSIPFARALEVETEIVNTSSSHANAVDGLEASLIKETYQRLGKELGIGLRKDSVQ